MGNLKNLFTKIKLYINQKYLINNVDNVYWKLTDAPGHTKITTLLKENYDSQIEKYMPGTDMEFELKTNIKYYNSLIHIFSKYLYKINGCILDPDYNWAIIGHRQVFKYSFPMAEDPWDGIKPRPSLIKYLTRKKPLVLEKAILVKYTWNNYYHFCIDALPQIALCDQFGLPADIPVIVPYNFSKISFVQEYFNKIEPPKRKIIIQEKDQYIRVKELYLAKDTFFSESITEMHRRVPYLPVINDQPDMHRPALLFVTRAKKYKRTIQNNIEIEDIVKANGFTIIEAGDYSLSGQISLFSNATHVIGIHGAGLMNIIFSKNPNVKVLEIFPGKTFVPGHYSYLSTLLGYKYRSMIGSGLDSNAEFFIDKDVFLNKVKEMMSD
jgi:hypothetical protein